MRKRYYFKVPADIPIPEMENIFFDNMKKVHKKLLKQSYRPVGSVIVRVNRDGDDFIKHLWTVLLEFKAYRIPRIVKNILMNRLKQNLAPIKKKKKKKKKLKYKQ